jgi:hypothetical protein
MEKQIRYCGGAIIGLLQVKTPLAKITVSDQLLTIHASVLGNYHFTPDNIVSIDIVTVFFTKAIKFRHNKVDFPKRIIFFQRGPAHELRQQITLTGFSPIAIDKKSTKHFFKFNPANLLFLILIGSIFFWFFLFR